MNSAHTTNIYSNQPGGKPLFYTCLLQESYDIKAPTIYKQVNKNEFQSNDVSLPNTAFMVCIPSPKSGFTAVRRRPW